MSIGHSARIRFPPLAPVRHHREEIPRERGPAVRLKATAGTDLCVDAAFWAVLGRPPTVRESAEWVERVAPLHASMAPREVEAYVAEHLRHGVEYLAHGPHHTMDDAA